MKAIKMVLFMVAFVVAGVAFARTEPVLNVLDQPVATISGKALTAEQVKQLISRVAREKRWVLTPMQNGNLAASLSWNNSKHTIVVEIACEADRYSLTYRDSVNMGYTYRDNEPVIHPRYNSYVGELREAIRAELLRM